MANNPGGFVKDYKWWCESCGTLTNDGECDCTKFPETVRLQKLRRSIWLLEDDPRAVGQSENGK